MNRPSQKYLPRNLSFPLLLLLLCAFAAFLAGCVSTRKTRRDDSDHLWNWGKTFKNGQCHVQGGRETRLLTSTQISDEAFTQALADSITKSQTFSRVVQGKAADYLLTVTLFNLEQPMFRPGPTRSKWRLAGHSNVPITVQLSGKNQSSRNILPPSATPSQQ